MKSTSIHSLNADKGLNFFEKILYLILNIINNMFPYTFLDSRLKVCPYQDPQWASEMDDTYATSSVGRRLSDVFWRTLPWTEIEEELGEIHIFDTGCGHGNYGKRLLEASGGRVKTYTGVDAKRRDNWIELETAYPNFRFLESTSSDIRHLIPPNANMFVTQSAIEHFDEDLPFFEQIREHIDQLGTPAIQIHNFPGRAILPLYLFHGIRQYTPRTVSKITRLFKDTSTKMYLYGLGGKRGKRVHWKYFTWPLLVLRGRATWSDDVSKYDREVKQAISWDMQHPSTSPIFWVLIIHSHIHKNIW